MATTRRQPEFRRLLSPGLLVALILALLGLAGPGTAGEMAAANSNYRPAAGEEFFLLAETSYASDEQASVRLEIQRDSAELEEYGGVDIAIYRVPDPLAFLRAQSNLHRVKVPAKPQPEGMANMLKLSWDKIWANTRFAWKRLFSPAARLATTAAAPDLKTPNQILTPTRLRHPPAYAPLPGMTLSDRFRYPVHRAKPIVPPADVKLAGSSSEFLPNNEGNVRVPLGQRAPGLYLVEASVGKHRAVTLVFVSDSVAVTKNAATEMLVWTARRKDGVAVADADVVWSDGVGVLKSGRTAADGVVRLPAASPETSYVYGQDPAGGVFISENFYHDSEIYNAKIYAVTDRPLYRPGDLVQVKFLGREFRSARRSEPVASSDISVTVVDPAGTEVLTRKLRYDSVKGGETDFRLPAAAQAGGWELVFARGDDSYGAAFRVADYVKPHFEIDVVVDKSEFKTREAVTGRIRLSYPDGRPVAGALVRLTARAQPLTMVEGELRYGGQFPVAIKADELKTGSDGVAAFSLPPADDPARYILSLLAQDGAAYRVRATKEILIERGATLWQLSAPAYFSRPGESVDFRYTPQGNASPASRPTRWEILRLEDRQRRDGALAEGESARLAFPEPGSYTVSLRDARGNLLAATSHWVSGEGMKAIPGSVEIVFDKESYQAGETAHALITFPQAVGDALLTLERDQVEAHALLSGKAAWLSVSQVAPAQWRADIPVREEYGPNVTFSVLYLANGDYVFQNKGLRVAVPTVDVAIRTPRERYAPGETVTLELETRVGGRPTPALVNLGVVDEMIYVLQPEIAPSIGNFFYHPRRNNVRTTVSLSFIGYDLARLPGKGSAPVRRSPSERGVKVLERPRRDDTDTAGWWPSLMTGQDGKVSVSFRMPDALTRWRVTARAITAAGVVGQQTRHVESHKDFYAKWTGPASFRLGDRPAATVVAFNQTGAAAKVQLAANGGGLALRREIDLQPGANNIPLPIDKPVSGDVAISLAQGGKEIDSLRQAISVLPVGWLSERSLSLDLRDAETRLALPADARDLRVSLAQGSAGQFARIAEDLLEFPWGCVEQTASRLLPLSFAYRGLPADAPRVREIAQSLATQRLRLVQMAGPEAVFGWWGPGTTDSGWLTAYAYYADWHAARALGLKLPATHWRQSLEAYRKHSAKEPLPLRVLAVWFMAEMELPVRTLVEGLLQEAASLPAVKPVSPGRDSLWLSNTAAADGLSLVLIGQMARQQQIGIAPETAQAIDGARESLRAQPEALGQALLAMEGKGAAKEDAARWLATLGPGAATLDRALALAWWNKALGGSAPAESAALGLAGNWQRQGGPLGAPTWRWTDKTLPTAITLASPPTAPLTAFVRYRSAEPEKGTLPVKIERRLYRLVAVPVVKADPAAANPSGERRPASAALAGEAVEFRAEAASDGDLRANDLYLEEIRLSPAAGQSPRYGLVEVPLPPGADVERGTWGIRVRGLDGDAVVPMEKARYQPGELSYAVPVDQLAESRVFRHLLRFGSRGSFVVPPARFQRMYQPEEKAFEAVAERRLQVK
ncbi:alpha-2-macroglobulin [Accumulibacter sp.]|uniref:alpha-2-macroglobulin family protein n=1 Tax=Accumulibacter sp. TaxID=2053492 RepID=UPI002628C935|nr:alpha-2-macroglobulin [Accumulibacter sp.]